MLCICFFGSFVGVFVVVAVVVAAVFASILLFQCGLLCCFQCFIHPIDKYARCCMAVESANHPSGCVHILSS